MRFEMGKHVKVTPVVRRKQLPSHVVKSMQALALTSCL